MVHADLIQIRCLIKYKNLEPVEWGVLAYVIFAEFDRMFFFNGRWLYRNRDDYESVVHVEVDPPIKKVFSLQ